MNILITGVCGLIGSQFANYLTSKDLNIKIIGIDDLSGGYIENINNKIIFYKESLNNYENIEKLFIKYNFYTSFILQLMLQKD